MPPQPKLPNKTNKIASQQRGFLLFKPLPPSSKQYQRLTPIPAGSREIHATELQQISPVCSARCWRNVLRFRSSETLKKFFVHGSDMSNGNYWSDPRGSGRLPIGPVFREPVRSEYATGRGYESAMTGWNAYTAFHEQTGVALPEVRSIQLPMSPMQRPDDRANGRHGPHVWGIESLLSGNPMPYGGNHGMGSSVYSSPRQQLLPRYAATNVPRLTYQPGH